MLTNKIKVMWKNEITAEIEFDYSTNTVKVVNYTEDWLKKPFGVNDNPDIEDLDKFFESRCFPKDRFNCKQLLMDLSIMMYDPLSIIEKTHGRQLEDYMWIQFDGEKLEYEKDIRIRD